MCHARLGVIFPAYVDNRTPLVSRIAGAAVFVFLYSGAVGGANKIRPSTVLWMCDAVAARTAEAERQAWHLAATAGKAALRRLLESWGVSHEPWYADNSREPLRDETLAGWLRFGAVVRDVSQATTSPKPQWTLAPDFAELFQTELTPPLIQAIERWQSDHLGPVGLARGLVARQLANSSDEVLVQLPHQLVRRLAPGASSQILKGVIEQVIPRLLLQPALLFISESRRPVDIVDDALLRDLALHLPADRLLPDALAFDADSGSFWFIEVVATDGPIDQERKDALLEWAGSQGLRPEDCRFLTAFASRIDPAFRRTVASLAWGTQVWFLDEPDNICSLEDLPERASS